MPDFAKLDQAYVWHPFTQMRDWLKTEPIVIASGNGAVLRDTKGKEYLDANSSIWTNLHGHNHPTINEAISKQLSKVAHTSALGFANEPASMLAERLINLAKLKNKNRSKLQPNFSNPELKKVFFSDDGSTAMEVALKLAYAFAKRTGRSPQPEFLSLQGAYHGDTAGAVSLGHIDLFHKAYSGLLFKTGRVMSPYCYRCPFNRAKPERSDAREYRKCNWECVDQVEERFSRQKKRGKNFTAFIYEPQMQGAAGMIPQPEGWLRKTAAIARGHGTQLIADEVMTGFGRTGGTFASHQEYIQPDFLAVAKGLTGGYLPMAATLTTQTVFDAFLGDYAEFKTFFHGHSFTGNQLGASAALASLDLLESPETVRQKNLLARILKTELSKLWKLPQIGDIRQVGLIAGIELVKDWRTREPFDLSAQAGIKVCEAMAQRGALTRPIGNVLVLMPPYCTTSEQLCKMVETVGISILEALPVNGSGKII